MDTNVTIMFKNLIFSSPDNNLGQMELLYENKSLKFNFPLLEPLKISLSQKFIIDKINLTLSIIELINKRNKLFYRADFSINKSIFLEGGVKYEKILTLIPTDYKDTKKAGKIYMEIQLLDSYEDWKKNIKNNSNKKSCKKINNTSDKKLTEKHEFDDNISLINISNIEDGDLNAINVENSEELVNANYTNQIKNLIENDYQRILPTDINSLKNFNLALYNKYKDLGNQYNEIIKSIYSKNEDIRNKAINYWNNYKKLKKNLYKKRIELKNSKIKLVKEKRLNDVENEEISKIFENYKNDKETFLNKLFNGGGMNDANNLAVISSGTNNIDIKMLSDAVKKLSSLGYDIIEGMKINEEERKLLSVILGINLCDNIKNEDEENEKSEKEIQEDYEENNIKEDFEFGNKIVALIERDVNELYSRKLIHQIKIDQIDAITYSFSDDNKEKNVSFKIENNNLFCIDSGESFTVWLLSNFST
jgi:hypothetical protein